MLLRATKYIILNYPKQVPFNFVKHYLSASREGKDHHTGVVRPCPPSTMQALSDMHMGLTKTGKGWYPEGDTKMTIIV